MRERNDAQRASDKVFSTLRSLRAKYSQFPLDFFLEELNDYRRRAEFRCEMAKAAAAYLHPRLTPVLIVKAAGESRTTLDVNKLTDRELDQLEQILVKCQVPAIAEED